MAHDEELDARITEAIGPWGATKKKMFAGTCFLIIAVPLWLDA